MVFHGELGSRRKNPKVKCKKVKLFLREPPSCKGVPSLSLLSYTFISFFYGEAINQKNKIQALFQHPFSENLPHP